MKSHELDAWLIVKTVTVWMIIAYVVCATAYLLLPSTTFELLWKPMFHAFNPQSVNPTNLVLGFLEAVIYTALGTWLLVVLYNHFRKR